MSESELGRIIDRAGSTSAPADLHLLAHRDRHGFVHLPLDATVELARAFAAAGPTTVVGYLDDQEEEEEMLLRGNKLAHRATVTSPSPSRIEVQSRVPSDERASNQAAHGVGAEVDGLVRRN
jgi:hypothetical protein